MATTILKTVAEIKKHFEWIKTTKNVGITYKCAFRFTDNADKQSVVVLGGKDKNVPKVYIPYPVLYPPTGVKISDHFADLEKLGYDTNDIFRTGSILYFSKKFVPAGSVLVPSKSPKSKSPSADFRQSVMAEQTKNNLTEFVKMVAANQFEAFVAKQWLKLPTTQTVGDYVCVSQILAKELMENSKIALAECIAEVVPTVEE